jgi:hypothetical protein
MDASPDDTDQNLPSASSKSPLPSQREPCERSRSLSSVSCELSEQFYTPPTSPPQEADERRIGQSCIIDSREIQGNLARREASTAAGDDVRRSEILKRPIEEPQRSSKRPRYGSECDTQGNQMMGNPRRSSMDIQVMNLPQHEREALMSHGNLESPDFVLTGASNVQDFVVNDDHFINAIVSELGEKPRRILRSDEIEELTDANDDIFWNDPRTFIESCLDSYHRRLREAPFSHPFNSSTTQRILQSLNCADSNSRSEAGSSLNVFRCNKINEKTLKACNRTFRREYNLNRHNRDVHGPKRKIKCDYCNSSYSRSDTLLKHVRTEHPNLEAPSFRRTQMRRAATSHGETETETESITTFSSDTNPISLDYDDDCGVSNEICRDRTKERLLGKRLTVKVMLDIE